jgi:hypothetical protein
MGLALVRIKVVNITAQNCHYVKEGWLCSARLNEIGQHANLGIL